MLGPAKKIKLTCSAFQYSRRTPRLSRGFLTGKCSRTSSRLRLEKNCVRHGRRWPAAGRRAKAHQLPARGVATRPFRLPPAVYHWREQRTVRIEDFYSYFKKTKFYHYQSTVPVLPVKYYLRNKKEREEGIKGQCHEMNYFFEGLKNQISTYFLYMHRLFLNFSAS
jgi:hypothetical protein